MGLVPLQHLEQGGCRNLGAQEAQSRVGCKPLTQPFGDLLLYREDDFCGVASCKIPSTLGVIKRS